MNSLQPKAGRPAAGRKHAVSPPVDEVPAKRQKRDDGKEKLKQQLKHELKKEPKEEAEEEAEEEAKQQDDKQGPENKSEEQRQGAPTKVRFQEKEEEGTGADLDSDTTPNFDLSDSDALSEPDPPHNHLAPVFHRNPNCRFLSASDPGRAHCTCWPNFVRRPALDAESVEAHERAGCGVRITYP